MNHSISLSADVRTRWWGLLSERSQTLPPRESVCLALLLITLQILDGIFTLSGVHLHGVQIEGNFLIRSLMHLWGPAAAVIFVKTVAVGVVLALTALSARVIWIPRALRVVAAIYFFCAILPWSAILLFS